MRFELSFQSMTEEDLLDIVSSERKIFFLEVFSGVIIGPCRIIEERRVEASDPKNAVYQVAVCQGDTLVRERSQWFSQIIEDFWWSEVDEEYTKRMLLIQTVR